MTPKEYFNTVWDRCAHIASLASYVESEMTKAIKTEDLLRSEFVSKVSALDLYVHELVVQKMVANFRMAGQLTDSARKFQISLSTAHQMIMSNGIGESCDFLEIEIRERHAHLSFQHPDKIAEAIRLISNCDLWAEVSLKTGANEKTKKEKSKQIRTALTAIINRRNKIVHEGDLNNDTPRRPLDIDRKHVEEASALLKEIVTAIDLIAGEI